MYLSQLYLKNFRNYTEQYLKFNKNINLLIGSNAQGKTNILESIYLIGTGSSHRTNIDAELINWQEEGLYLKCELIKENQDYQLELSLLGRNKEIKINSNRLSRINDLIGYLNIVIFSPEDLNLVKGSPNLRRKFIDLEISQISPYYRHLISKYGKVLKQRNNLLKEIRDNKAPKEMLSVWDQQLIDLGAKIIKKRLESLIKLGILSKLMQRKITNGLEALELKYDTELEIDSNSSEEEIKESFKLKLKEKREREIYQGATTLGPHRDDISLIVNNIDIRKFGSQGQQRTAALALKLAELEFMKGEIGEYPILLLDDVFSELDLSRRSYLLDTIRDKIQTFITSTDLKNLNGLKGNHKIFEIKNGSAIEV
ncbi:DNA replication/repair protein RecF [Orenia metallireducens]|uniref:DNA replication and repair protein RecF n=1 Tax=Orenia metallireducens TaxID=1413210 RepID=A0A1C0ACS6_9FIRM|nr:DNA replication/repair protein RecF [Orenia metallireducens]OCL28434.1 DNA replication/repair protein RecF [Orenia metallireducens]